MLKKGQEAKVDEQDKATFEEVQKIVAEQEQKLKEWTDGPTSLSAVSFFDQAPTACFKQNKLRSFLRNGINSSNTSTNLSNRHNWRQRLEIRSTGL